MERDDATGLAALNVEVTRQASIIAYSNDFKFLFFLTLSALILVLFMRGSAIPTGGSHAAAVTRRSHIDARLTWLAFECAAHLRTQYQLQTVAHGPGNRSNRLDRRSR